VNVVFCDKNMEILYQQLSKKAEVGISLLEVELPYFIVPWHYHPEVEIIYIEKSEGSRFVGDHSEPFQEGDIALIGSNLPHVWKNSSKFMDRSNHLVARALVVHFHELTFKGYIYQLPEMQGINKLLRESDRGIKFTGPALDFLKDFMKKYVKSSGINKLTGLIEMLAYMAETPHKVMLASEGYTKMRSSSDFNRFDKVHLYLIENFHKNITLNDVAHIAGMTPTSFCRYFRKRTNKSFVSFLNEIRIGHACKLLMENKLAVSGISLECGFNNISNFNQLFKRIKGMTPSQFINIRSV
jgi:AraC-like DNA-binding protein